MQAKRAGSEATEDAPTSLLVGHRRQFGKQTPTMLFMIGPVLGRHRPPVGNTLQSAFVQHMVEQRRGLAMFVGSTGAHTPLWQSVGMVQFAPIAPGPAFAARFAQIFTIESVAMS